MDNKITQKQKTSQSSKGLGLEQLKEQLDTDAQKRCEALGRRI